MKRFLIFLSFVPFAVFGQNLQTKIDTDIRGKIYDPRLAANMYQAIVDGMLAVTASGTNTYTATVNPAITSYQTGYLQTFKFTNANTGASTLNVNGLGAKSLVKDGAGTALASGDLKANTTYLLSYDGTNFQVLNIPGAGGGGGGSGGGFVAQNTAPANTNVRWIDTGTIVNQANPIRDYIAGAWTVVSDNCDWWDNIGKVLSKGKPIVVAFSGQSNCLSSFYTPQDAPSYTGDVATDPYVTIFNYTTNQWKIYDFSDQAGSIGDATPQNVGTNSLQTFAKLYAKKYNRSVRLVGRRQGGTALAAWEAGQLQWTNLTSTINSASIEFVDVLFFIHGEAGLNDGTYTSTFSSYQLSLYNFISRFRSQSWASSKTKFIMPSHALGHTLFLVSSADLVTQAGAEKAIRSLGNGDNLNNAWAQINQIRVLQNTATQDPFHWTTREQEWMGQAFFFEYEKLNSFRKKEFLTSFVNSNSNGEITSDTHIYKNSDDTKVLWTSKTSNTGTYTLGFSAGGSVTPASSIKAVAEGSFSKVNLEFRTGSASEQLMMNINQNNVVFPKGAATTGSADGAGPIGQAGFMVRNVGAGGSLDVGTFLSNDSDGLGLKSAWSGSNNPNFRFWFGNSNQSTFEYNPSIATFRYQFKNGYLNTRDDVAKVEQAMDANLVSATVASSGTLINSLLIGINTRIPPNSVLEITLTITGVRNDNPNEGTKSFTATRSATYRKDGSSTWTLVSQGGILEIKEDDANAVANLTFTVNSNLPSFTFTRGATPGTYAVSATATYTQKTL